MGQHLPGLLIVKHSGGEKRPSPAPQSSCSGVNSSLCEESCKVPSSYPVKKVRNVSTGDAALCSNSSKLMLRSKKFLLSEVIDDNHYEKWSDKSISKM